MIKIITGSTGSNHITSDDDRQFNNAIYGDSYVLPLGEKFKATLVDNNTITISDGDLVLQGCHARINAGTTEDVTIETGAIGVNRIDLIVARYELDSVTGYEDVNLVVIKGEESVNPVAPAYNTGSLRNGANVVDMPLYKVSITGISIEEVQQLFTVSEFIAKSVERLNSNLTQKTTINISDTNIPSGTPFEEIIQMLAEKVFPRTITGTFIPSTSSVTNISVGEQINNLRIVGKVASDTTVWRWDSSAPDVAFRKVGSETEMRRDLPNTFPNQINSVSSASFIFGTIADTTPQTFTYYINE